MARLGGEITVDAGTIPEQKSILQFSPRTVIRDPDILENIAPTGGPQRHCGGPRRSDLTE